jgi:ferritin-like metal-binding protein YciE
MPNKSFHDLYIHELKDTLSAETQIQKALPKIMEACDSEPLKSALNDHLAQTKQHATKIKKLLESHGEDPTAIMCEGMEGLLKEGDSAIEDFPLGVVRDSAIIAACQKVEHYEICAYGTLRAMANTMNHTEDSTVLTEILHQESMANDGLTQIALQIQAPLSQKELMPSRK